jgi:beta-N-acetylhexosaminidase
MNENLKDPGDPWGQWLWVSLPGEKLGTADRRFLSDVRPAGVVLFSENGRTAAGVKRLVREIREALRPAGVLIAIDQEGGRVARLREGVPETPPMRTIGRTNDPVRSFEAAFSLGRALKETGVDIDFAPVLDVDSNPRNPVIGDRAFSGDPGAVGLMAMAFAHGLEAAGIVPCGKHFPGHGDTSEDSHFALPVVKADEKTLAKREWVPFERAIAQGIPLLMTAHVLYPELDPKWPATLSYRINRDLLRKRLGFDGLLVSDDLSMAGVGAHFSLPVIVRRALGTGCDGLLVLKDQDKARRVLDLIREQAQKCPALWRRRLSVSLGRLERIRFMCGRGEGKGSVHSGGRAK